MYEGWTDNYIPAEADVAEGQYEAYFALMNEVQEETAYASQPLVAYKVTYDNGQTVELLAVDKFQASAEADEILVAKGYNLDDLMFSPKVEVV